MTAPERFRRDSSGFKSTSYFGAVAALRHARKAGCDEALFRDGDAYVEGSSTALVAWNGGRLAGLGPGGLPSVTAEAFLEGAGERRGLGRGELLAGSFLLGSLTTAAPILSLDGEECARPPAMLRAIEAFRERLRTDAALQKSL
jgi:branched-subunit amino acid aminotransferase/4-amino-4-deoxychorismate lyase